MKSRNVAYWITTILVAFFIGSGGVAQVARVQGTVDGFVHILGYPPYFVTILGVWKVLGAIAILVPRFPRLKEWAYAGIFLTDGRRRIHRFSWRIWRLRLPHPRPTHHRGITVASWAFDRQVAGSHPHSSKNWRIKMKIKVTGVYVDDQEKALRFYWRVNGDAPTGF